MGLNNPGGIKGVVKPHCLLENGGFETGDLTGWGVYFWAPPYGTPGTATVVDTENPPEGAYCVRLWGGTGINCGVVLNQYVECYVPPETLYFKYKYPMSPFGQLFFVIVKDNNGNTLNDLHLQPMPNTEEWIQSDINLIESFLSPYYLYFRVMQEDEIVYIDNVQMK